MYAHEERTEAGLRERAASGVPSSYGVPQREAMHTVMHVGEPSLHALENLHPLASLGASRTTGGHG